MKGRRYLAAVALLVLTLGSPTAAVPSASEQGSWKALGDTLEMDHFWQFTPGATLSRNPAAAPFTAYAYDQTNVDAGDTGAAIAYCPDSSVVVGGGYSAQPDVTFFTQYKYGNGWRGDAKNNSAYNRRITVYAVCLHNLSGATTTQVHGQVDVVPGKKAQAVATCPADSIASGGGFYAYPDGSLWVYNSSKADSGEGWQSWAQNMAASTKTHHAYAICLSGSGGKSTEILESAKAPPGSYAIAIAKCSPPSLVTGGGFAAQTDLLIYSNSGPWSDTEWKVYVKNTHASDERMVFGYAICLSLPVYRVYLPHVWSASVP